MKWIGSVVKFILKLALLLAAVLTAAAFCQKEQNRYHKRYLVSVDLEDRD